MATSKRRIRNISIALSATMLALCPVAMAALISTFPVSANQPFATIQPVQASFAPPVGSTTPVPTLIPTLGPGQGFVSTMKPDTITEIGSDEFGYGEIAGTPG